MFNVDMKLFVITLNEIHTQKQKNIYIILAIMLVTLEPTKHLLFLRSYNCKK